MSQKRKHIYISVTNDLVTDQRVHKVCETISANFPEYKITLIGRLKKDSKPVNQRAYNVHRISLRFEKGFNFYAEYNLRLFLYLLFKPRGVYFSNDLDTLLPNFLLSKIKGGTLIYDSHEYFTEVPELLGRKRVRAIWLRIESYILPKLKTMFTVNETLARIYSEKYHIPVHVVRNVPNLVGYINNENVVNVREKYGIAPTDFLLIYQGAVNKDRGLEELIEAFNFLPEAYHLLIIGSGDVYQTLLEKTMELKLKQLHFLGQIPFSELAAYTLQADLGVSLEKSTNLNYRYALPNKVFDYIAAGIPILVSPLKELCAILDKHDVGKTLPTHEPKVIAETIKTVFSDEVQLQHWKANTVKARGEYCWEKEEKKLVARLSEIL
jgi:glycosyltransferase involved in cell wall biosynthesis